MTFVENKNICQNIIFIIFTSKILTLYDQVINGSLLALFGETSLSKLVSPANIDVSYKINFIMFKITKSKYYIHVI